MVMLKLYSVNWRIPRKILIIISFAGGIWESECAVWLLGFWYCLCICVSPPKPS